MSRYYNELLIIVIISMHFPLTYYYRQFETKAGVGGGGGVLVRVFGIGGEDVGSRLSQRPRCAAGAQPWHVDGKQQQRPGYLGT